MGLPPTTHAEQLAPQFSICMRPTSPSASETLMSCITTSLPAQSSSLVLLPRRPAIRTLNCSFSSMRARMSFIWADMSDTRMDVAAACTNINFLKFIS